MFASLLLKTKGKVKKHGGWQWGFESFCEHMSGRGKGTNTRVEQ
jgi:hypothetical protein